MTENYDFGQLYRAALAETNPEEKSRLLREVQFILLRWQQQAITSALAERKRSERTYTDSAA
jgi:ABC-type transport system substrate-binding protein